MEKEQLVGGPAQAAAKHDDAEVAPVNSVEGWLRANPVPNAASFRALTKLAPAQRAAIVAELHKRYGNAFVAEQMAAAQGVAAAGDPLPHKDAIQRAFGRHDVGSIQTQTGGEAAEAANELGAMAFASGEQIAFAKTPDLHTAAHEAAHVVQQRRGLAPGGLGAKDGASEEAADRIADRVVAGVSAEDLLDGGERESGHTSAAPIQAKTEDKKKSSKTQEHWDWFAEFLPKILDGIELQLGRIPNPHARLQWIGDGGKTIFKRIKARAEIKPEHALKNLWELVAPADLWSMVERARLGPRTTALNVLKEQLGIAFVEAIFTALPRVGMRAVVQWDVSKDAPDPDSIVPSSPLDMLLAGLLADKTNVKWTQKKQGSPSDTENDVFKGGTRRVTFEYAGAKDSNLWNWIKVTSPANATAEDVAATPLGHKVPAIGADQAFRFAISPPYFGVPIEVARHIDEFKAHMTVETLAKTNKEAAQDSRPIVDMADRKALRDSKASDDAALAQAPKAPGQLDAPRALHRARTQVNDMTSQLAPYAYTNVMSGAVHFIERREAEASDPKKLARWGGALEAQERILHDASSELREVIESITKQGVKPEQVKRQEPVRDLLVAYARAGGLSHLHAEGPAALAEARRLRGRLSLSQAEFQVKQARLAAMDVDNAQAAQKHPGKEAEPHAEVHTIELERQDAQIRSKLARGEKVSEDEIADLQVDAAETELRARLAALSTSLRDLQRDANDADAGKGKMYGVYSVDAACEVMLRKINGPEESPEKVKANDPNDVAGGFHARLDRADKFSGTAQERRAERAKAVRQVNAQLDKFRTAVDFKSFFEGAQKEITNARMAALIRNIVLQVGLAVITGEAIGAIGIAIRGIALAGEIGAEIRNASLAWEAASVVGQAAANTIVSGAMGGPMDARTFIENGLAIVLTSAAMKPFQGILNETSAVESQIVSWGRTATKGGRLAAELVIETGVGIGAAGVAHAVTHGGHAGAQDAESWVTMGLSIAASKYVGKRTHGMKERLAEAMRGQPQKAPNFEALSKRAEGLEKAAEEIGNRDPKKGKPPTPEEALALMRKHHELVKAEHELYANDPTHAKRRKANEGDAASDAQLLDASLQLAHLSPVVDGHVYEGNAKQIEAAFKAADEIGIPTKREWVPEHDVWRVKSGEKTVEIHEMQSWHESPAEVAAAHSVKETNFTGKPKKGETRAALKPKQVKTDVADAVKLLGKDFTHHPDGSVTVKVGSDSVEVAFRVGKPRAPDAVASHTYKKGANQAEVVLSEHARPQDIQRAAAHELSEIRALMTEPKLAKNDALVGKSESMKLSAHDYGRLGELDVLLSQAKAKPGDKDIAVEMDGLLDHLGFEPKALETNARARDILGKDRMREIVEAQANREVPHKDQYKRGKEDSKETIENEFEQGIADAEKTTKDGRVEIKNAQQVVEQRAKLEQRPEGVSASDPTWAKYMEYVAQRSNELRLYYELKGQGKKAGTKPEPMITWKKYQQVRNPFERGTEFQQKVGKKLGNEKVSEVLGDKNAGKEKLEDRFVIEDEVGVASRARKQDFKDNPGERETPQRPDHLAVNKEELAAFWSGKSTDPPTAVAFSDKSYDFKSMSRADAQRTVDEHIAEAVSSYGGKVEIRSDKFQSADKQHSLRDVSITVDTIVLVYDKSRVGTHKALIEARAALKKHGKTIKVIYR